MRGGPRCPGTAPAADIEKRWRDRWNFLFIAGMWFQDLYNYDFRRTERCIRAGADRDEVIYGDHIRQTPVIFPIASRERLREVKVPDAAELVQIGTK